MVENINPKVSIIMVTLNRAKYIGTAIESVLNQDFKDWELLIIDGGSRDNTEAIVKKYQNDNRIRYIKPADNLGLTGNRNLALEAARANFIAVLDSDDVWLDEKKLDKQVNFLERNRDYVLVGTNFEKIDENGRRLDRVNLATTDADIRNNLLLRNEFCHSSVVFRKTFAPSVNGLAAQGGVAYNNSLFIWEDLDLWLRLGLSGKLANLSDYATAYRKHPDSISGARKIKGALTILKIIKRYRKSYPHYFQAYIKGLARVVIRALGL